MSPAGAGKSDFNLLGSLNGQVLDNEKLSQPQATG